MRGHSPSSGSLFLGSFGEGANHFISPDTSRLGMPIVPKLSLQVARRYLAARKPLFIQLPRARLLLLPLLKTEIPRLLFVGHKFSPSPISPTYVAVNRVHPSHLSTSVQHWPVDCDLHRIDQSDDIPEAEEMRLPNGIDNFLYGLHCVA